MSTSVFNFTAEDSTEIFYNLCKPSFPIKARGLIIILHGMGEYKERYRYTAQYLCSRGFICTIPDLRGHGESNAENPSISDMISDIHKLHNLIENEYSKLPFYILGHSLGSFIALQYAIKYGTSLNGIILSGTGGISQLKTFAGLFITGLTGGWYKSNKSSLLVNILSFADFNRRIKHPKTFFDWICSDEKVVKEFIENRGQGLSMYSSSFYLDLIELLKEIHSLKNLKKIPDKTSILLISGTEDPVGRYGREVKKIFNSLRSSEKNDVTLKFYKGARHEILNEPLKDEVLDDIQNWLNIRL